MSNETTIAFIGGGNMAASLIGGLIADGRTPQTLWVSDTDTDKLAALEKEFAIRTSTDNNEAAAAADIVVLAVKPQVLHQVAAALSETIQASNALVISVAAGIRAADLDTWLGGNVAIVRCMPNTPALIRAGAGALFANDNVSAPQRDEAEQILNAVGLALWVDQESQMDAVTALSGSGPAYFFLFMEAMEEAGVELGLERDTARRLALQTGVGATRMAQESDLPCAELRRRVTSPGGTTEQALNTFEKLELRSIVGKALRAASDRSAELADQLAKS